MIRITYLRHIACGLVLTSIVLTFQFASAQFPGMPQPKHYAWSDSSFRQIHAPTRDML
jgi:hypothetical protein